MSTSLVEVGGSRRARRARPRLVRPLHPPRQPRGDLVDQEDHRLVAVGCQERKDPCPTRFSGATPIQASARGVAPAMRPIWHWVARSSLGMIARRRAVKEAVSVRALQAIVIVVVRRRGPVAAAGEILGAPAKGLAPHSSSAAMVLLLLA